MDKLPYINLSFLKKNDKVKLFLDSATTFFSKFFKRGVPVFTSLMVMMAITINGIGTPLIQVSPLVSPLQPLVDQKSQKEVFGFAPYWTFNKLDKVDFDTLTTIAYFGVPVLSDGTLDKTDQGYITFESHQATQLFQKAHQHGTRVVLTLTQMNNWPIQAILDDPNATQNVINQGVDAVQSRGIDGINVDFEYQGDPGQDYRDKFTHFIDQLTQAMHKANPNAKVTVSVYAASVKDPKIYDVGALAKVSDGIFMMAYDFANSSSDVAMPTAPLFGASDGTYWYDVSTAVNDFLRVMPANKLILGVPWYGYNYSVGQPQVKALTGWGGGVSQPYSVAKDSIQPDATGWDNEGKVGWEAYQTWGGWRMIFVEDAKSLGLKYDFAKSKNLEGIGIWALGFDDGKPEMWSTLKSKFTGLVKDTAVLAKAIKEVPENDI